MNSIKQGYYFLFYRLYILAKKNSPLPSDFVAGVTLIALDAFLIVSLLNYYNIFVDRYFHLEKNYFIAIGLGIALLNMYLFNMKSEWKASIDKFEKVPKAYNYFLFLFILIAVGSLVFSYYLMSQIDWTNYR